MADKPRYLREQETQVLFEITLEEKQKKFAMVRRINKCSNYELLQLVLDGTYSSNEIAENIYQGERRKESWTILRLNPKNPKINYKLYVHILSVILKKSDNFLDYSGNAASIYSITEYYGEAINKIEDWEPLRRNVKVQCRHLIKFLFANYDVPGFLYKGFEKNDINYIYLFLFIGSGKSFKKFDNFPPLVLNKKIYPYLLTTPEDFTYNEAFRRAQILSMGGDERLIEAIGRTILNDRFRHEDFWVTVIQLFINTAMLNMDKVPEIIDFIHHQKFEINAPHPTFCMKGRTITSLLRQSDEWHQEQARQIRIANIGRPATRYESKVLVYTEWDGYKNIRNYNSGGSNPCTITQIFNNKRLREEGQYMRNCVLSYQSSCLSKKCTIFSLRKLDKIGQPDLSATIEVRMDEKNYLITQIRDRFNKRPGDAIMKHVTRWATSEFLLITRGAT